MSIKKSPLAPEYRRAMKVFMDNFESLKLQEKSYISNEILVTNNIQLVYGDYAKKDLPKGTLWRWHQTKAKKYFIIYNGEATVKYAKLQPRRIVKGNTRKLPSLKLWYFEVTVCNAEYTYHFLWCERGCSTVADTDDIIDKITYRNTESKYQNDVNELKLEDFSFLGEFMTPDLANYFWPRTL